MIEVRPRTNTERGEKDSCSCGLPFLYVAVVDGKTYFFWCSKCDTNDYGRKNR